MRAKIGASRFAKATTLFAVLVSLGLVIAAGYVSPNTYHDMGMVIFNISVA